MSVVQRWLGLKADLRHELSQCLKSGTKPPFADAAFFYAENVRTRGGAFSATQRISPNQPFNRINFAEVQTTHSLRSVSTIETRTKRTCVFAAIRVQNVKIMVPVYVRRRRLLLSSKTTGDEPFQRCPLRKKETWHILAFN